MLISEERKEGKHSIQPDNQETDIVSYLRHFLKTTVRDAPASQLKKVVTHTKVPFTGLDHGFSLVSHVTEIISTVQPWLF